MPRKADVTTSSSCLTSRIKVAYQISKDPLQIIINYQSVLPKGRSLTAILGTKSAVLPPGDVSEEPVT